MKKGTKLFISILDEHYRQIKFGRSEACRNLSYDFKRMTNTLNIYFKENHKLVMVTITTRMKDKYPFLLGDEKGFDERFKKWTFENRIGGKK